MSEERHNKIVKINPQTFSIKMMYDIFLDFLQDGDDGWEVVRNKPWPYGAVLKVPNWKDGEYGYVGMMYGQIEGRGKTHSYSVNKSTSYGKWITGSKNLQKLAYNSIFEPYNVDYKDKDWRFVNDKIQQWITKETTQSTKRYSFSYGTGNTIAGITAGNTSATLILASQNPTGTIKKGTYITIGSKEVVIIKDTSSYIHTYQKPQTDSAGNPVLDTNGNPIMLTITENRIDIEFSPTLESDCPANTEVELPAKSKQYITSTTETRTPANGYYYIREAEQFYTDADVIWFNMFKQYEPSFDWNELMENTRKNPSAKRLGWSWYTSPYPNWEAEPPIYPGEGCPAIASDRNTFSKDFETSTSQPSQPSQPANPPSSETTAPAGQLPEYVYLYMSKTKHNANLAVNYRDWWDMAQVGFFEPFASDYEYQFPALVMSSNIGVRPCNHLVSYGGNPYPYDNMLFDYTQGNRSWGHSMIGYSATWWDGTQEFIDKHACSQTQAMLPSGKWESFFNYAIRSDYWYSITDSGHYSHGFKEPEKVNSRYFITNTMTPNVEENFNVIPYGVETNGYSFDMKSLDLEIARQNKQSYSLLPFYLGTSIEDNKEQNMICAVPAMYAVSRPVTRYGLYKNPTDTDDMFLIMPNCWEGRPWHYQQDATRIYTGKNKTEDEQIAEYEQYRDWGKNMNVAMHIGKNTSIEEVEEYVAKTKELD